MNRIEALAEAWASMDGKLEAFQADAPGSDAGYLDGYTTEAAEMIVRLNARGFDVTPTPDKTAG